MRCSVCLSRNKRRIGHLSLPVVLYGMEHPQDTQLGWLQDLDIKLAFPGDMLLIAGTRLTIPALRRFVVDFVASIRLSHEDDGAGICVVWVSYDLPPISVQPYIDVAIIGNVQAFAAAVRRRLRVHHADIFLG